MVAATRGELPELPDLVLLKVLELLPLRDRLRAARVCRRWRRLALDRAVWKRLDLIPYRVTSRILWALVRRQLLDGLHSLQLGGTLLAGDKRQPLTPALLLALSRRCPHLHHLCLAEMNLSPLPSRGLPQTLSSLELRRCELPSGWFCSAALPRLQHLVVTNVPAFSDHHLLAVTSQSHLKTLSLTGTYRLTTGGIQRAAPHLQDLQDLALRHCSLGDATLAFILLHSKQLCSLDITKTFPMTNQGLADLRALQRLEALSLDLSKETSPSALLALCQALPHLKKLNLGGAQLGGEVLEKIQATLPHCSFSTTT